MDKNNNNFLKEIKLFNNNLNINNMNIRIYYFDILRIISSFAVILIHVSSDYYYQLNINHPFWKIVFYFNGIPRFGVPIFFMISGALFLNRNISLKIIFVKYNIRILIHILIWSFIYSIYNVKLSPNNIEKIIHKFFSGHYHLWYLYSTIQLYIITPFLREIVKNNLLKDLIKLSFIYSFLVRSLIDLKLYYPEIIAKIFEILYYKLDFINLKGNFFYFMLGYYLNNYIKVENKNIILIYILGLLGFLFTTIILYKICIKIKKKLIIFFGLWKLNILIYSASIFILFKEKFNNLSLKKRKFLKNIAFYTFGIYLIHPLIIDIIIKKINFSFNILIIPLKSIIVFILSFLISLLFKNIPFFGKYIC